MPLEWLKLGLLVLIQHYLPLNSHTLMALQVYLLLSTLALIYLTATPLFSKSKLA